MSDTCPEYGAPVLADGPCPGHFHALLLLEEEIPGVLGSILHFGEVEDRLVRCARSVREMLDVHGVGR